MGEKTNMISIAVQAAGGRRKVAENFEGCSPWTVTGWQRARRMPAHRIRPLCEMGGNVVTPDQLLAYIEQAEAEAKAAA